MIILSDSPRISKFESSVPSPIESNSTLLSCVVDSRPDSTISISYKLTGAILDNAVGNRDDYTFPIVQCLDTGVYQCTANNGIGPGDVIAEYYMDVKCTHYVFISVLPIQFFSID